MMLTVGLTGGIASGKSTVRRLLDDLGCFTIDADALVGELYEPGGAGHQALVREYGDSVLDASGHVNRVALADRAFSSALEAERLNRLVHPLVIEQAERRLRAAEARSKAPIIGVVEATLLLEAGGRSRYDRIVVVDLDPELQVARGVGRGMTEQEVRRRIARQMRREDRLALADFVVDNGGTPEETAAQVRGLAGVLREELSRRGEREN